MRHIVLAGGRPLALAALVTLLCTSLAAPPTAEARSGSAAPPAAVNPAMGEMLFDQCVQWVSMNGQGIVQTNDFYIDLLAELDLDTSTHRGPMRIWWQAPDKYRQELTANRRTTTKILNGDRMWIVQPTGQSQRMHGTAAGVGAIRQLKDDRERLGDLAQFMTLRGLKGPGVRFTFVGPTRGSGTYAGNWLKITRHAQGGARIHFWLAHTRNAQGQYRATYPGIVRIDGDPARNLPTEDYILKNWVAPRASSPRALRYPSVIEAYSIQRGRAPLRFLRATVRDIKINSGIDASRFRPPMRSGPPPRRR